MALSSAQAAAALDEIDRTERRTYMAKGYSIASPYLILWGLIWIVGYGACAVLPPERWGVAWLPLIALGTVASVVLGVRTPRPEQDRHGAGAGRFGQSVIMALAVMAFIGAVYYLFKPASPAPYLIFPSFVAALVYVLAGALARMQRFVWIGLGMFAVTLGGYVAAPQWSAIWAAAGGAGLVLGGLWLRKA